MINRQVLNNRLFFNYLQKTFKEIYRLDKTVNLVKTAYYESRLRVVRLSGGEDGFSKTGK